MFNSRVLARHGRLSTGRARRHRPLVLVDSTRTWHGTVECTDPAWLTTSRRPLSGLSLPRKSGSRRVRACASCAREMDPATP